MQPETIAAGLVATHDAGIVGQTKASLGLGDLGQQQRVLQVRAPVVVLQPGQRAVADGERQLPLAPARLESEVQSRRGFANMLLGNRCRRADSLKKKLPTATLLECNRQRSSFHSF